MDLVRVISACRATPSKLQRCVTAAGAALARRGLDAAPPGHPARRMGDACRGRSPDFAGPSLISARPSQVSPVKGSVPVASSRRGSPLTVAGAVADWSPRSRTPAKRPGKPRQQTKVSVSPVIRVNPRGDRFSSPGAESAWVPKTRASPKKRRN